MCIIICNFPQKRCLPGCYTFYLARVSDCDTANTDIVYFLLSSEQPWMKKQET